jgi:putative FmdB family regulatory protein
MPFYEYECPVCSTQAEVMQSFEAAAPTCENDEHKATMVRLVSVPFRARIVNGCTGAQRVG